MSAKKSDKNTEANLCLISEDTIMADFLSVSFEPLTLYQAPSWPKLWRTLNKNCPYVVILDDDGSEAYLTLAQRIKKECSQVRLIAITARQIPQQRVQLLENGVDVCLLKPFEPPELKAYVHKYLRVFAQQPADVTLEQWRLNPDTGEAWFQGQPVPVSPVLLDLFMIFVQHANQILSRQDIARKLWGHHDERQVRTVDQHILRLRKLLAGFPESALALHTYHRKGYALLSEGSDTTTRNA